VIQAVVDPFESPMPAKITVERAAHFAQSLIRGEPNREKIVLTVLADKVRSDVGAMEVVAVAEREHQSRWRFERRTAHQGIPRADLSPGDALAGVLSRRPAKIKRRRSPGATTSDAVRSQLLRPVVRVNVERHDVVQIARQTRNRRHNAWRAGPTPLAS